MPREIITPEQRKAEAAELRAIFESAQANDPSVTQEAIALEMSVTQGLIHQWLSAKTPIPTKRLQWLADRLLFKAERIRPSLKPPAGTAITEREKRTIDLYLKNPDFAKIVNTIAETTGLYETTAQRENAKR